jgi:hypothetical protein
MNFIDAFISRGYTKSHLPDDCWQITNESPDPESPNILIVNLLTKTPVFHPCNKYQFEPNIIQDSFEICFDPEKKVWEPGMKSPFVSRKFTQNYTNLINKKIKVFFREYCTNKFWILILIRYSQEKIPLRHRLIISFGRY